MNKTLLLIICDFLLLNLLALTRWERAEPTRPVQPPVPEIGANAQSPEDDLVAAMRLALTDEQQTRQDIAQQLAETAATLEQREESLTALQAERARLSTTLEQTQSTAADLGQQVALTKEQLDRMQRELDSKREETVRQQQAIDSLEKQQATARDQIQGLQVAVRVAEQEKNILQQTAETFRQQAEAERQERQQVQATTVQLAQGVGELAQSSSALRQEIQENRPINANVLFSDFLANRVLTQFSGTRPSLLSSGNRESETHTVFVTDGRQTYALMHVADTPFVFDQPFVDWTRLQVEFAKPPSYRTRASTINFLSLDPRIVAIPVTDAQVQALGVKIYRTALDPVKFPDAVLISGGGEGYGELPFSLDPDQPGYVRVDNRFVRRLSGSFTPSRGDLVLSRTGELLGIMVNSDYCAIVDNFLPTKTISTGEDIKAQATGAMMAELTSRIRRLPIRMQ